MGMRPKSLDQWILKDIAERIGHGHFYRLSSRKIVRRIT